MIKGGCYPPLNREHEYHTYSCLVNTWVVIDATYARLFSRERIVVDTNRRLLERALCLDMRFDFASND
jgi:hypothetical protein